MSLTMWPRNDGSSSPLDDLGVRRPGLGELPCDPPDLHDRHAGRVAQHDRHLQDHLEAVADAVGREGVEGLGAVAGLQQERLAVGHLAQRRGEVRASPANASGGSVAQVLEARLEGAVVGPRRLLRGESSRQLEGAHVSLIRTSVAVAASRGKAIGTGGCQNVDRPPQAGGAADRTGSRASGRCHGFRCRGGGCAPATSPSCTGRASVRYPGLGPNGRISQAASLRASASSRTADHRALDEPSSGLHGHAEGLADLAVAALATVVDRSAARPPSGPDRRGRRAGRRRAPAPRCARAWPRGRACRRR